MAAVAAILATLVATGATAPSVAALAPVRPTGPSTQLQRDVDAIRAAGIVGVLGEQDTPRGRRRARSGIADLDSRRPVPYGAYFRIGSTTKTFVATVVLQLVGEHRLSLEDSVDRWLPGLVAGNGNDGTRITVRQLLQHTSGLYDYTYDLIADYDTPDEYQRNHSRTYTPAQRVAIAMQHPPNFAPGTAWSYSNTNYILAGMLIQQVTGHPWYREVGNRSSARCSYDTPSPQTRPRRFPPRTPATTSSSPPTGR